VHFFEFSTFARAISCSAAHRHEQRHDEKHRTSARKLAPWTLEEISRLISSSGNPSETPTNIVNLIQRLRPVLADEVVPLFYNRDADGLPRA